MEVLSRRTTQKWWLLLSVLTLFSYGAAALSYSVLTWLKAWDQAEVMYVADYDVLVLITAIVLVTFAIGITGTILNSRPILAMYALLLWPALISILASQWHTPLERLIIQDTSRCCGYFSPLHEAASSPRCYARSPLPGCKGKLLRFEKANLKQVWATSFSVVPLHIPNIFVSLLCVNYVTKTFGKGIIPKQYRLKGADVQADAEKILGALRSIVPIVRPTLARSSTSATFREDKADVRRASDIRIPTS
ncbi:hypothetical protein BDY19DRAFT_994020 [Irpex rosettiformis]|uniref:Uncharacterized protein n=1 Tax=Irpex rosettiformis TaxID=378272 RepID=A0ACB8U332_9APHY|nr:hypothetical protein BDY19DRAFT_994020 [Irpex rosettiformis]